MSLKVYDANEISMIAMGIPIESGFADGEFCRIEQNEDDFTLTVGTDGQGTRSKTNNRSAKITIILMQTSASNAALSALNILDRNAPNGAGVGPCVIKDLNGTSLYFAASCWIAAPPKVSFDRGPTAREWTLETDDLERLDGGN